VGPERLSPTVHTANYAPRTPRLRKRPKPGNGAPGTGEADTGKENVGAGRAVSPTATILRRKGPIGEGLEVVRQNDACPAGELLLGLPGAVLDSANGAVRLSMRSTCRECRRFPVVENAWCYTTTRAWTCPSPGPGRWTWSIRRRREPAVVGSASARIPGTWS